MITVYVTYYSHIGRLVRKDLFSGDQLRLPGGYRSMENGADRARADLLEHIRLSKAAELLSEGALSPASKKRDAAERWYADTISGFRFDPVYVRDAGTSTYSASYKDLHDAGVLRKQFYRDRLGGVYRTEIPPDIDGFGNVHVTAGISRNGIVYSSIITQFPEDTATDEIARFVDSLEEEPITVPSAGSFHLAVYAERALLRKIDLDCLIDPGAVVGQIKLGKALRKVLPASKNSAVDTVINPKPIEKDENAPLLDRSVSIVYSLPSGEAGSGTHGPKRPLPGRRGLGTGWTSLTEDKPPGGFPFRVWADRDVRIVEVVGEKYSDTLATGVDPADYANALGWILSRNAELIKVYDHVQSELEKISGDLPQITERVTDEDRIRTKDREMMAGLSLRLSRLLDIVAMARTSRQDAALSRDGIIQDLLERDDRYRRVASLENALNQTKTDIDNWLQYLNEVIDQRNESVRSMWFAVFGLAFVVPSFVADSIATLKEILESTLESLPADWLGDMYPLLRRISDLIPWVSAPGQIWRWMSGALLIVVIAVIGRNILYLGFGFRIEKISTNLFRGKRKRR
jgi:hypothetical protein